MLNEEEIENTKIELWNIRADILKAMQCSLADTSDKNEWQKEIDVIDNALKYIEQLENKLKIADYNKTVLEEIKNKSIEKTKERNALEKREQKLIDILEKENEEDTDTVKNFEGQYRNSTNEGDKISYKRNIDMANARREVRKHVLEILKGENQVTVK